MIILPDAEIEHFIVLLKETHLAEAAFVDKANIGQCIAWHRHHQAMVKLAAALGVDLGVHMEAGGQDKPPGHQ